MYCQKSCMDPLIDSEFIAEIFGWAHWMGPSHHPKMHCRMYWMGPAQDRENSLSSGRNKFFGDFFRPLFLPPQPSFLPFSRYNITSMFSLTNEELVLHRYAAMVDNDLRLYKQIKLRDEVVWKQRLQNHLVHIFSIYSIS